MLRVGAERGDVLSNPHGERWRPWPGAWTFSSPSGPFLNGFSPQLAHPYRTMILRAMETIVSNHISELDKDMTRAIILLASSEMTKVKVCAAGQAPSEAMRCPCRMWPWLRGFFLTQHASMWVWVWLPRGWPLGSAH